MVRLLYEQGGGSCLTWAVYNIVSLTGLLGPAYISGSDDGIYNRTPERTVDNKRKNKSGCRRHAMLLMEHANGATSVMCAMRFHYFDPYGHEGHGQERPTISMRGARTATCTWLVMIVSSGADMATTMKKRNGSFLIPASMCMARRPPVISESMVNNTESLINAGALHCMCLK